MHMGGLKWNIFDICLMTLIAFIFWSLELHSFKHMGGLKWFFFYIYIKCETLKGLDSQLVREYMFFGEVIVAQLLTNALRKYNCAIRLLRGILVNMLCHSLFLKFFCFFCLFVSAWQLAKHSLSHIKGDITRCNNSAQDPNYFHLIILHRYL